MINNQIQSPVTGKNNAISGQSPEGSKADTDTNRGGLFKLLMNSVQGGNMNGKKGQSSGANILGGNLTLNARSDSEGKQSALHLLTGSGEENKKEKITLSKLLEGSESKVESSGEEEFSGETNSEAVSAGDKQSSESSGDGKAEASGDETVAGELQSGKNSGKEAANLTTGNGQETGGGPQVTGEDAPAGGSDLAGSTAETQGAVPEAGSGTGEQAAPAGEVTAQQQTIVSGGTTANGTPEAKQTASGEKVESKPLNGLIKGQESADKNVQSEIGPGLAGDKTFSGQGLETERSSGEGKGSERPELVKTEGLVNELRALAAAQGEQLMSNQQQVRLSTEQLEENAAGSRSEDDGALIQEIFSALQNGSIEQVAAEIRSLKASQMRETRYSNYLSAFANRQDLSNGAGAFNATSDSSTSSMATGSGTTMMPVPAMVPSGVSVSGDMFDENGAVLWKEQITEYFESKDKSASENQAAAAFARLGEVPVTNISVRRSFAQGISQAIVNSTGDSKKGSDVWQKHNFVLEDGKNIQVSARKVEGVLQLKLSSSYSELNKLLMEHENEIRDLLENELELKIDLQMNGGGDSSAADFFGGSSNHQSGSGSSPLDPGTMKRANEQHVEEVVPRAVRKFGYNQMEWTV
jgi:hypothetical protein